MGGSWSTRRKTTQRTCKVPLMGSNSESSRCEATVLTTAPSCHAHITLNYTYFGRRVFIPPVDFHRLCSLYKGTLRVACAGLAMTLNVGCLSPYCPSMKDTDTLLSVSQQPKLNWPPLGGGRNLSQIRNPAYSMCMVRYHWPLTLVWTNHLH